MIRLLVSLLVPFSFHVSALKVENGSLLLPRTFLGRYVTDTYEPFDYDPSALDSEKDEASSDSSSGAEPEPVRSRDLRPRKQLVVSEETRDFLQGPLSTTLVPTVYTLVFLVSVPLNLVAVLMFSCHVRPLKPAVIYMLNLACCDLLFGLLLPFKIAYHYGGNDWTFGPGLCAAVTAAFYCNMYCSVLLVTCISADRFLAVVFPMNSLTWRSPGTAWAVCVTMWLLALGGALPLLVSGQTNRLADLGITTCHDVQDEESLQDYYLYFFPVYSVAFFFVPLVSTVVCYAGIIHALAGANVGSRSRKESWQKKTRAVVMAAVVLVVFVVCFTPTNVILMVHYAGLSGHAADASYQAYLLSMCVGSVSCCLDPVLYYFGSSQCQKKVAALLGCRRPAKASKSCGMEGTKTSRWTDSSSSSSRSRMMESIQSDPRSQYSKLMATWKQAS